MFQGFQAVLHEIRAWKGKAVQQIQLSKLTSFHPRWVQSAILPSTAIQNVLGLVEAHLLCIGTYNHLEFS